MHFRAPFCVIYCIQLTAIFHCWIVVSFSNFRVMYNHSLFDYCIAVYYEVWNDCILYVIIITLLDTGFLYLQADWERLIVPHYIHQRSFLWLAWWFDPMTLRGGPRHQANGLVPWQVAPNRVYATVKGWTMADVCSSIIQWALDKTEGLW